MRARNGRVHGAGPDRRRRSIVLSIGLLTLLSMSPILGHHLAGSLDGLLAGTDHLGALCLIALRALLAPVHDIFHVLLAAGVAYASWERVRANHLLRKTISSVTWKPPAPGGAIEAAAEAVAVDPARVQVARGLPVPAFTAGWLRPRIYLAAELADRLSPQELAAVLAHEGAHAARRDPLCLSVLRFLGNALFWIPVLRKLAEDCADEVEFRADDDACRGQPYALASAILAAAEWGPSYRGGLGVGIHNSDLLTHRVRRLAGMDVPARSHVTRSSILGAACALALVWVTGVVMAHPLPDGSTHAHHCDHPHAPSWTHLFCARETATPRGPVCPHEIR